MITIEHSCPDIHKRPRISFEILLIIAKRYSVVLEKNNFKRQLYIGISLDDEKYLYLDGGDYYVTAPELIKKMNLLSFTAMVPYNQFIADDVVKQYAKALSNCTKTALEKVVQARVSHL